MGIDAFEKHLRTDLGWDKEAGFTYHAYRAGGPGGLDHSADKAVHDLPKPDIIVTAGSMATDLVRGYAGVGSTIAIIQSVGGTRYTGITNVTGFYIDAQKTCIDQLAAIATPNVSILWDNSNDPSVPIQAYLSTHPAGKALTFLTLAQLTGTPSLIDGSTFMLIPNENFYSSRHAIANAVESRGVHAVYPEREYRLEYSVANRGLVTVHGHQVPFTYIQTAQLADKILRGVFSVGAGTLPPMKEAEKDNIP
jgi:hypothetical protein